MHKVNLALLLVSIVTLISSTGYPKEHSRFTEGVSPSDWQQIAENVNLLCLFVVDDGRMRREFITPKEMQTLAPYEVDGYISGIVAFCRQDMDIHLEGQPLSRIRKNGDGTFSIKYFGRFSPDDMVLASLDQGYYEGIFNDSSLGEGRGDFVKGGYSFFPKVTGDAVSARDTFRISFSAGSEMFTLPFRQTGTTPIGCSVSGGAALETPVSFHYFGNELAGLQEEVPDYQARLAAIADGIQAVEKTFKVRLVDRINILDYRGIHNAVTCRGRNEIWFYVEAFKDEPLGELKTIAEHETLHKLVGMSGLLSDSKIRGLFADLKGFGLFSMERFLIMTKGIASRENSSESQANQIFFSFINEQNFLENRKGGHSHENMDEFCTSFLHSLMFVDRLNHNLDRPVRIYGTGRSGPLSAEEKDQVLELYAKTIDTVMTALEKQGRFADAVETELPLSFFADCMQKTQCVLTERQSPHLVMQIEQPAS